MQKETMSVEEILQAIDYLLHDDPCTCDTCMALTAASIELAAVLRVAPGTI